ncbi:DUF4116 domain-containing protein [Endozoicomonas sp. SCSIO W0465]
MKDNPRAANFAGEELKQDKTFISSAIQINPKARKYLL